jgi:hypothetical protein
MHHESEQADAGLEWAGAWCDMLSKWAAPMRPFTPDGVPPEIGRELRSAQLKWWGDYWNRFLRSPEFLAAMKNWMATVTESRQQANDLLGEVQHAMQGATREDIDRLAQALRRHEENARLGTERIVRQLNRLSRRLAALENGAGIKQ